MSMKEMLDIVVIPIVLLAIALMWPTIQNLQRRRTFMKLIFRELEEIGPYPMKAVHDRWGKHLAKKFTHREILAHVSENRDFILSLDPDLVDSLSQLWDAYDNKDKTQWLYHLKELAERDKTGKLKQVRDDWTELVAKYPDPTKSGV